MPTGANPDLHVVGLRQSSDGQRELLLSDGRRRNLDSLELRPGPVSAAFSPSGAHLGLLCGHQVIILDSDSLNEMWRSEPESVLSCCWDWQDERLLLRKTDRWQSLLLTSTADDIAYGSAPLVESEGNEPWSAVDGCLGIHLTVVTGPDGRAAGRDVIGWLTHAPETAAAGYALQDRRVVIPPWGFAESPLAELPAKEFASPIQWSPDGSSLGWTDEEGLKVWQRGDDSARFLLRWPDHPLGGYFMFGPDSAYVVSIIGPIDTPGARVVVVRRSEGAATEIGSRLGKVAHVEWGERHEVYIAYDFGPSPEGGYEYKHQEVVNLLLLPEPWRLSPDIALTCQGPSAAISLLRRGHDKCGTLPIVRCAPDA